MESEEIVPIDEYNAENGKLMASTRWLIAKVYGRNIPDVLINPFMKDENNQVHLKPPAMYSLTSGELYCAAASKIFQDSAFLNQTHAAVIQSLSRRNLEPLDNNNDRVTETQLKMEAPLNVTAHMSIIDGLMTAHVRQSVTVDKVVMAVGKYSHVDDKETPLDSEDALLFWINKICSAVRDNLEKIQRRQGNAIECPVIPEMEDLYEDMCDGACLCTLIAFYQPQLMKASEICLNDSMGIGDCAYNLRLVRRVCEKLPTSSFHFQIEDLLYLHEYMQPNVNAFLADLFIAFENAPKPDSYDVGQDVKIRRHYDQINPIPDLRNNPPPPRQIQKKANGKAGQTSMMNSVDSLMTNKSVDSLKYNRYKPQPANVFSVKKSPTTTFGDINSNRPADYEDDHYMRADSMPGASASIRLALEEKRRQYNAQRANLNAQMAKDREQKSRDAFFTLLGKNQANTSRSPLSESPLRVTPASRVNHMSMDAQHLDVLNKDMMNLMNEVKRLSTDQRELVRRIDEQREEQKRQSMMSLHEIGRQNSVGANSIYAQPQQQQYGQSPVIAAHYATLPNYHHQSLHSLAPQNQQLNLSQSPMCEPVYRPSAQIFQTLPHGLLQPTTSTPMYADPNQQNGHNTFRLHSDNEPPSRLDPALELNRNLTNWGMTYKTGVQQPRSTPRRTWDSEMWAQVQMQAGPHFGIPGNVPNADDYAPPTIDMSAPPGATTAHWGNTVPRNLMTQSAYQQQNEEPIVQQRQIADLNVTPPRRKPSIPNTSPTPAQPPSTLEGQASGGAALTIGMDAASSDRSTMEMEQRREQLLANAMRRKENMDKKRELMEAKAAAKRVQDEKKREMEEQKKLEKELHRQRIRDEYERRKLEQQQLIENSGMPRSPSKQTPGNRGKSQPPRTKSQTPTGIKSARSQNRLGDDEADKVNGHALTDRTERKIVVESLQDPDIKPKVKPKMKSNRNQIMNSLQYSVFAGVVHDDMRKKVMEEMAKSDSKHFLLLFRDQKCQYRAVYEWDEQSDNCSRIIGNGPKVCTETMMDLIMKYDSGAKNFQVIPGKRTLSSTVDAFTIKDAFWKKINPTAAAKR